MFELGTDGSAITFQIPVSPFVPLQHNNIDVSTVNRLANFGLRFALEHGWCRHTPEEKLERCVSDAVDEGYVDQGDDVTVFYAGVDAELIDKTPRFSDDIVPAAMLFWGQFWVSNVGKSSYGIYGKLFYYEAKDTSIKTPFGEFRLTGVTVSKTRRKPVPIPSERAELFRATMARHASALPFPLVERIDVSATLTRSALFEGPASLLAMEQFPTHPSVDPLAIAYRRTFKLRETDIDFNRHVNQMAMIQLVINTFRSALGDPLTVFPRLLDDAVEPLVGDLLIRRFRIDYVHEIAMKGNSGATITLFFGDDASRDAVIASSKGQRRNTTSEIWFAAHGLPSDESQPFLAVVGKMFVFC